MGTKQDQTNLLSIIIPCFNQGHYIQDALDCLDEILIDYPFEIIIVNDGSTDPSTINKLNSLSLNGKYTVINQENMGLAKARNVGIKHAKGKYILPLDADNKIHYNYINKALPLIINNEYDVVYCTPAFFGQQLKERKYKTQEFDLYDLLERNYIDACAVYRKEVWTSNNGYDAQMPIKGYEDWEFWIHAAATGFRFHYLKEELFFYRISKDSMIDGFSKQKFVQVHQYLIKKYPETFLYHYIKLSYIKRKFDIDIRRWIISSFINLFYLMGVIKKPVEKAEKRFHHYNPLAKKDQDK